MKGRNRADNLRVNGPSRRLFLQLGGLAAVAAACAPRRPADTGTFTPLRRRWREVTLGYPGTSDPEREPYRTRLTLTFAGTAGHEGASCTVTVRLGAAAA